MNDVTIILQKIEAGDRHAAGELLPLVYDELRALANQRMSHEASDHTLQPTALVHEAFLRLVGGQDSEQWDNRGHFFGAAAKAMRRILIESARKRKSTKHGGQVAKFEIHEDDAVDESGDQLDLLALDDALHRLQEMDAELAKLVELRYFTGLTVDESAQILGISPRTAKRNWAYARAWLRRELDGESNEQSDHNE